MVRGTPEGPPGALAASMWLPKAQWNPIASRPIPVLAMHCTRHKLVPSSILPPIRRNHSACGFKSASCVPVPVRSIGSARSVRGAKHRNNTRRLTVRSSINNESMAASVLSKPHRFILVSDLDWTMVRASYICVRKYRFSDCLYAQTMVSCSTEYQNLHGVI